MKPEIRRPKAERNSNVEIRSSAPNAQSALVVGSDFGFRVSAFFRPSDFRLRAFLWPSVFGLRI